MIGVLTSLILAVSVLLVILFLTPHPVAGKTFFSDGSQNVCLQEEWLFCYENHV